MNTTQLALIIALLGSFLSISEAPAGNMKMPKSYSVSLLKQRQLVQIGTESYSYPYAGTFFELENGRIAFFTSTQYDRFRAMLSNSTSSQQEKLLLLNPLNGKTKLASCLVTVDTNRLIAIDGETVTSESMDRLRLSKKWDKILQFAWPRGCSVLDLSNGRFLISGGYSPDLDPNNSGHILSTALVINTNTNTTTIEKKIDMTMYRAFHSTVLLPDGTVFCVGGEAVSSEFGTHRSPSAEIIDVEHGRSTRIKASLPIGVEDTTVCIDEKGNPLIFGGRASEEAGYSLKDIALYDLKSSKFRVVGTMKKGRYFPRGWKQIGVDGPKPNKRIEICAVRLKNGQYLVDGGKFIEKCWYADFISGDVYSSEIVTLSDY